MTAASAIDMLEAHDAPCAHVLCATYNFDPAFFENYLLRHVGAFAEAERVTVLADAREVAGVVADGVAAQANRRYLLHGVDAGRGRFHAKFVLSVSEDEARLTLGSANLTESAWFRNLELVDTYEATPDAPDPEGVFSGVLAFAEAAIARTRTRSAARSVRGIRQIAPWLGTTGTRGTLLTSVDGPLLDQLIDRVRAAGERVESIEIMSPYFDVTPVLFDALVDRFGAVPLTLYVAPGRGVPADLAQWAERRRLHLTARVVAPPEDAHDRFMHAKAVLFRCGRTDLFVFGSANATRAALLDASARNDEMVVIRTAPRARRSPLATLLGHVGRLEPVSLAALPAVVVDDEPAGPRTAIAVLEAFRDEDAIVFRVSGDVPEQATGRLRGVGDVARRIGISKTEECWRTAQLPGLDDLFRSAVRFGLVDAEGNAISTEVFVDALLEDAAGGGTVRRAVKRAAMNSLGFEMALEAIQETQDRQALIEFFWFVDVPGIARASGAHAARTHALASVYVPKEPLDLLAQLDLDRALDAFWRRHLRRLARVAEDPQPDHAPVALHLLAALHGGLEVQTAEVLALLRSADVLSVDEWKQLRDVMDRVLRRYIDLSKVLAAINDAAGVKLRRALSRDANEVRRGYDRVVQWKADIDAVVPRLRIAVPDRPHVAVQYFPDIVSRWAETRRQLDANVQPLLGRLGA